LIEVTAALIWNQDKFMICQRPANKERGLLWEFPGGKLEEGETLEECLIRECQEELGIKIKVKDIFMEATHQYPDITIHLTVFNAEIENGEIKKIEHNDIQWISNYEIDDYRFCPADIEILRKLKYINIK